MSCISTGVRGGGGGGMQASNNPQNYRLMPFLTAIPAYSTVSALLLSLDCHDRAKQAARKIPSPLHYNHWCTVVYCGRVQDNTFSLAQSPTYLTYLISKGSQIYYKQRRLISCYMYILKFQTLKFRYGYILR